MLVKKRRCHCHHCRHSDWNERTKKWFTRGTNVYKDTQHRLWVKRLRQQKHNSEIKETSIGYTD